MNNNSLSTATCWRSGLVGLAVLVEAVRRGRVMEFWRRSAVGRGVKTRSLNRHGEGVVSQRAGRAPGTLVSVYTGAIARFLVGNSCFKCLYVI